MDFDSIATELPAEMVTNDYDAACVNAVEEYIEHSDSIVNGIDFDY